MNASREGFSMVEVVVAMVLLAIILTSLAGFTFTTARSAIVVGDATTRESIALETVNRLTTLPFSMLAAQAGTDIVTKGGTNNRYQRQVAVTLNGTRSAQVVVTITPLQRNTRPTVVQFTRPGTPPPSPLCTVGPC
jgi:prepilin-type N-terminal cleavage/methylation domain-containing protein